MTKKQPWNIWRIKNRWIRAVFTALVMAPLIVVIFALTVLASIGDGIIEGARSAWWCFNKSHHTDIYRLAWRAVTLREAE